MPARSELMLCHRHTSVLCVCAGMFVIAKGYTYSLVSVNGYVLVESNVRSTLSTQSVFLLAVATRKLSGKYPFVALMCDDRKISKPCSAINVDDTGQMFIMILFDSIFNHIKCYWNGGTCFRLNQRRMTEIAEWELEWYLVVQRIELSTWNYIRCVPASDVICFRNTSLECSRIFAHFAIILMFFRRFPGSGTPSTCFHSFPLFVCSRWH